jgi:hypothetical protein
VYGGKEGMWWNWQRMQ